MTVDISTQLLAFNFRSRTKVYNFLSQSLRKSEKCFCSFLRLYLDPFLASDLCAQGMDDMGSAVKIFEELIPMLRKSFTCIQKFSLELSPETIVTELQTMTFPCNVIAPEVLSYERTRIEIFLKKMLGIN